MILNSVCAKILRQNIDKKNNFAVQDMIQFDLFIIVLACKKSALAVYASINYTHKFKVMF